MSIFDSNAFQNGQPSGLEVTRRLSEGMIDGGERLVRLQFQALRMASDGYFACWRQMLSMHRPEKVAELSPVAQTERMLEYGRQLHELVSASQRVFLDLARQQMDAGARQLREMVTEVSKNAPTDAEPLVNALETVAKGADCLYGSGWKAAGQSVELANNVVRLSRETGLVTSDAGKPKG